MNLATTRPEPGADVRALGFDQLADHLRDNHAELSRNMRRKIVDTVRRVFKPRPKMTVDQCADAYRYIPKEASADFGKYRVATYAIAYGPLRAVTERGVQVITVSASTQLMKTSFLECVILFFMVVDPSPMILLQPTKNLAKVFSKRKVDLLIDHTPKAREALIDRTTAMKIFYGGDLMIVTAASENDLKMVPRRIRMSDEVETIEDHVLDVPAHLELPGYVPVGQLPRPAAPGSVMYIGEEAGRPVLLEPGDDGIIVTAFRPRLTVMLDEVEFTEDEGAASVSWSISGEEQG